VHRSYLLVPKEFFLESEKHRAAAPGVVAAFQSLWHPDELKLASGLPTIRPLDAEPEEGDDIRIVVPKAFAEAVVARFKDKPNVSIEVIDESTSAHGEPAIASFAAKRKLRTDFNDFDRDLFALAFMFLALSAVLPNMQQDDPIDDWSIWRDVESALRFGDDDPERRRDSLQAAHESLANARNLVFPSSVNLLDLALWMGEADAAGRARMEKRPPTNLFITGSELDAAAISDPDLAAMLKSAVEDQRVELLSGPFDHRPWTPLSLESKVWQIAKTNEVFRRVIGKEVDAFGSRTHALTPDLPALLAKHQFRGCYHGAFDGSGLPYFKSSKLHWAALDGTTMETVCRTAWSAEDETAVFLVLRDFAKLLDDDRSPAAAFVHRFGKQASWFDWWTRASELSQALGRFQTLTDYSLGSALPHHQTHTRAEEYDAKGLENALARGDADPISAPMKRFRQRMSFDSCTSLAGLARCATDGRHQLLGDSFVAELERSVETGESAEYPGGNRIDLETIRWDYAKALSECVFQNVSGDAQDYVGLALINPCSFARRVVFEYPSECTPKLESPVRAIQQGQRNFHAVVDVPGWGWAWLPFAKERISGPEPAKPIAAGLKLKNEFIEVEIDKASGGLRGLWDVRTGFSRLGQQIAHTTGGKMVARGKPSVVTGPAFGEIRTEGELLSPNGKEKWATFKQTYRLWTGRPVLEMEIHLEPIRGLQANAEDYFALRWAWPDEKAIVSTSDGLVLHSHRGAALESPLLVDIRERNMLTTIIPHGLPYHRRSAPRMMDTVLLAAGETARDFKVSIAIDFARPVSAAMEALQDVAVIPVSSGPPKSGVTGTFASISPPSVLASVIRPQPGDDGKVTIRLVETMHKAVRAELKFAHRPRGCRFINGRGDVIYDVYPSGDVYPLDFNASETHWVEAAFGPAPSADDASEHQD
jgi:alpha-mannosidase